MAAKAFAVRPWMASKAVNISAANRNAASTNVESRNVVSISVANRRHRAIVVR